MSAVAAQPEILFAEAVHDRLVSTIRSAFPRKCFGYLLSEGSPTAVSDFILFEENVRNEPDSRRHFESYGRYFVEHHDAGFVASPEETWRVQKEIWARGLREAGVFHSHRRHPANFSSIDYALHMERFENLWHLIVSMRNPLLPQLRAFSVSRRGVRELGVQLVPSTRAAALEGASRA
jgi:proteasome lid subunit RPN8/RPN11